LKNLLAAVKDWKNLAFAGAMLAVAAWVYSRVAMVNPAILGDEYLYSINARKAAPWDPSPYGDFSNYLFNVVYSTTNLCGDAFYTCGKLLNLVFFIGFLTVVFIVARRYLNYWVAFAFTILSGLSPLSVYTSMFLPEMMYFFFLSLVFASVLRAGETYAWKDWALAGALIGATSLVKPHAWLSAMAIGIYLVTLGLTNSKYRYKALFRASVALALGAILGRLSIGLIVAGPKSLSFFGDYVNAGTITELAGTSQGNSSGETGQTSSSPLQGAIDLFGSQLWIHTLTNFALMTLATIGIVAGVIDLFRAKESTRATNASLLGVIWLVTLVIQVVLFTGWITGGGDDHSTRVLERYYDFLFVFVPLIGLIALSSGVASKVSVWFRLPLAFMGFIIITPAFSGFFGGLTIQIADAPNLAGLVVNQSVFNSVALLSFASLVVFAFAPKFAPWMFIALLPFSMVGTGYQIQDQYQGFRGAESPQDVAGQYLNSEFTEEMLEATWIAANSRFEATNVAIWADLPNISYDLFGPGSVLDETAVPSGKKYVLITGELSYQGQVLETTPGEGFTIYRIR
jgi:phosphoglycerol transferase